MKSQARGPCAPVPGAAEFVIIVIYSEFGLNIYRREKELLKPNLTSLCTDVLVQLNFVSINTIYLNKLTRF